MHVHTGRPKRPVGPPPTVPALLRERHPQIFRWSAVDSEKHSHSDADSPALPPPPGIDIEVNGSHISNTYHHLSPPQHTCGLPPKLLECARLCHSRVRHLTARSHKARRQSAICVGQQVRANVFRRLLPPPPPPVPASVGDQRTSTSCTNCQTPPRPHYRRRSAQQSQQRRSFVAAYCSPQHPQQHQPGLSAPSLETCLGLPARLRQECKRPRPYLRSVCARAHRRPPPQFALVQARPPSTQLPERTRKAPPVIQYLHRAFLLISSGVAALDSSKVSRSFPVRHAHDALPSRHEAWGYFNASCTSHLTLFYYLHPPYDSPGSSC